MNRWLKTLVIIAVLLLECVWLVWPWLSWQGYAGEGSFRHHQRYAAWGVWERHPSPKSKAAFDKEVRLLDQHIMRKRWVIFAGLSIFNGIGIYWFWNRKSS